MEQIILGNIRVQLLSDEIVRIEYGKKGEFCDDNTFFIPNRTDYTGGVVYTEAEGVICFGEYKLHIPGKQKKSCGRVSGKKRATRLHIYKIREQR